MSARPAVDWYFDVISPYAYLQAERLAEVDAVADVRCVPILFAGLLERWGQKGPAEIAPKRRFTYRQFVWQAARRGLDPKIPPAHPFNPLKLLRLAIALDAKREAVLDIFRFVWRDGLSTDDPSSWKLLCDRLGVPDADARIAAPEVKARLRDNGEEATTRGVFGVPTFVTTDGELFWGEDATPMLLDYLAGAPVFRSTVMQGADDLPMAAQRIPITR
jgi:2-hydroxychromene-2-carboxylate isomerase